MTGNTEKKVLEQAVAALDVEAGQLVRIEARQFRRAEPDVDAALTLGHERIPAFAEIKPRIQQANLGAVADRLRHLERKFGRGRGVLVTGYVNPDVARKLKELGVQFIDTAGNAFLEADNLFVYIKGNKQKMEIGTGEANRAFEPTGLRVVYAFLRAPDLVNQPYRAIAEQTGVANGTVAWVIKGLIEAGFLRDLGRGRGKKLVDATRLFYRWVEAYPNKLQKKLELGNWVVEDPYWWQDIDITEYGGVWGGEIAGAKMTNNLNPLVAMIYMTEDRLGELARARRMKKAGKRAPDEGGLVRIYQRFWRQDTENGDITDPILTYADLTNTGDPRNLEIAQNVYDNHINRHLREIA